VFVVINGVTHYLWRAVDQDGHVLDILVQSRRDKRAAVTSLRRLLKVLAYVPQVVITDTLASYGAVRREILPGVEHRRHTGLHNRAEHSHQPTRARERRMRRFKDLGHARRFLAADSPIVGHVRPRCHRLTAAVYRETRHERFATWRAVAGCLGYLTHPRQLRSARVTRHDDSRGEDHPGPGKQPCAPRLHLSGPPPPMPPGVPGRAPGVAGRG